MEPIVIGVAGGTGSGKSTFTNRLKEELKDHIAVLYHDNYYKRQDDKSFEERKLTNYDHPDALETELLVKHIQQLKSGQVVYSPTYDYSRHNRSDRTIRVEPRGILLVEGILVLQDVRLRELLDIKIYVEADADERILRRAIRDVKQRGRSLEDIYRQYITTVKPMHYLYVAPTKAMADIVINSGMNDVAFDMVRTKIQVMLGNRE